ncbi:MAG: Gfo/Idh/MocA family oxidoreductase, partial [Planctomycetota bacterium]
EAMMSDMNRDSNRRAFLRDAAGGVSLAALWHVNPRPAAASRSPLEKLKLASIGTANRAAANLEGCAGEQIVALADIDDRSLAAAAAKYRGVRTYRDFRALLEEESDRVDAVVVSTPDHTHAPAAAMALRMGKPVYCEKPLTHTVAEARLLADLAAEKNLATQMGTQIHAGDNYRRVVEMVRGGVIGPVREVHVWAAATYNGGPLKKAQKPTGVDWDLWLGPAAEREYVECAIEGRPATVHPYYWRWYWDYGNGGLGDFGCHFMDLAHWALDLQHPTSVAASGPEPDSVATTSGVVVQYEYPARGELPPVSLTWYDGGKRPPKLQEYRDESGNRFDWKSGQLFIGERGAILSDYGRRRLLPVANAADFDIPEPSIPDSIGHHREWIEAIKSGSATTCNFGYSGALTEAVLLGVVSYRSGEELKWDAANLKVTNSPKAQQLIHKEYRDGWSL